MSRAQVWDGTQWVDISCPPPSGGNGGFTYFQSATPTASAVGETWFDTNNGRAKVWDGFLWVQYALYPGGDTATGDIFRFEGGGDASAADGTGIIQLGADGGPNIGIDTNEIQSRNGGSGTPLYLNLEGGLVSLSDGKVIVDGSVNELRMPGTSSQIVFQGAGPNGLRQDTYTGDGGSLVYRTTPQAWFFETGTGAQVFEVSDVNATAHGRSNEAFVVSGEVNNVTRPFIAIREGPSGNRVMYFGYPDPTTKEVRVWADQGPLQLGAASTTDGVRSSTIYNATANDWGVFIEANGRLGRTASSERFKTNIEDLTADEAAEILADFDWVRFNYRDDETGEAKDMIQFGGIAERLHPKRPEFVGYDDEDRPAAIRYNAVWPLVARVTQAQQERIDSLEATVAEQGEQIAALTARLDALG